MNEDRALTILNTGPRAIVQDLGRPGFAHLGVTRSGAYDRAAHARANALVGNSVDAATIECVLGGLEFQAGTDCVIAVAGAPINVSINDALAQADSSIDVPRGAIAKLARPRTGLRTYLAIAGGIAVDPVLGSASTDTMSGLGPPPLRNGDRVSVGTLANYAASEPLPNRDEVFDLATARIVPGPHADVIADSLATMCATAKFTVSPNSDRIGLRLEGTSVPHECVQLDSEPTIRGAIQLPPDGYPVILGPDRPTTGGYPVIGCVIDADLNRLAQWRPGQPVTLEMA